MVNMSDLQTMLNFIKLAGKTVQSLKDENDRLSSELDALEGELEACEMGNGDQEDSQEIESKIANIVSQMQDLSKEFNSEMSSIDVSAMESEAGLPVSADLVSPDEPIVAQESVDSLKSESDAIADIINSQEPEAIEEAQEYEAIAPEEAQAIADEVNEPEASEEAPGEMTADATEAPEVAAIYESEAPLAADASVETAVEPEASDVPFQSAPVA